MLILTGCFKTFILKMKFSRHKKKHAKLPSVQRAVYVALIAVQSDMPYVVTAYFPLIIPRSAGVHYNHCVSPSVHGHLVKSVHNS